MIKAGEVAAEGIAKKRGEKNAAMMKQTAMEKEVRPERPPSLTPAADSTYVVVVEAPTHAPAVVAMASAKRALFTPGILPSSLIMPALPITPIRVPMVSNRSMKRKVITTISISRLRILCHSNCMQIGETSGGMPMIPFKWVSPIGMPISVVAKMPMSRAPFTLYINNVTVKMMPMMQSRAVPLLMSPSVTSVAGFSTMMPEFFKPKLAINRPIPTEMDALICDGIALTSFSRRLVTLMMMKMIPSMRMAVKAKCQE